MCAVHSTRAEIEERVLSWMNEARWQADTERFESIALDLFRIQFEACRPYALLCESLSLTPDTVKRANDVPAVPAGAFKSFPLRGFAPEETVCTFRTSGTSSQQRGELHLDRLDLYEASLLSSLRQTLLTGWPSRSACMRILAPDPSNSPDSSLSHMFGTLMDAEGAASSGFDLHAGELSPSSLLGAIEEARQKKQPMLIAGTAFAFVHLLDANVSADCALPPGSRVMETGGFKGRSRVIPREDLHAALAKLFSIPLTHVINQYGMTELGSQFYDSVLLDPKGPRRKLCPPWTRVRFLDPLTQAPVTTPGQVGIIQIHDLANTGSVAVLQTADLGQAVLDRTGKEIGFDVLGRAEGAEARGCSIAADVMLEASRGIR